MVKRDGSTQGRRAIGKRTRRVNPGLQILNRLRGFQSGDARKGARELRQLTRIDADDFAEMNSVVPAGFSDQWGRGRSHGQEE